MTMFAKLSGLAVVLLPAAVLAAEFKIADGSAIRVDEVARDVVRIRRSADGVWRESGLNRYGFLKDATDGSAARDVSVSVDAKTGAITVTDKTSGKVVAIDAVIAGKGYRIAFPLVEGERIFGLGDCSRKSVQRRPGRYEMWVSNNICNVPVPMFLSSRGYGVFNNSTWRHAYDVGQMKKDELAVEATEGFVDFYVFFGRDVKALISAYTRLTGRPRLLPVWGYGLTYVANQEINDFELCAEARTFRKEGIPCDIIGLDPGWMSRDYDMTTQKYWNRKKFHIPYWTESENLTFVGALKRMGFHLSLWTCCDYDLTRYEEECVRGEPERWKALKQREPKVHKNDAYHWWEYKFVNELEEACYEEGVQPWFEHWKKFVKAGVEAFKLDGCNQYGEHPDRKWANGMSDREVHNLYTAIYAKQMSRGYEQFTGRRAMVNSAGGYAGVQHYVATWSGDTGGGLPALMSAQCLGFVGHANTSSDLETSPAGLHYGFLQAWTFHDNWDFFKQPWYLGAEKEARFRHYAKLRYRLMPYLYSAAAEAHETGCPIVRALALEYPEMREYDEVKGTYLLGRDLLVSAFESETVMPPGTWYEWATGRKVVGPCKDCPTTNGLWSGGLYVRAGAIIPTWPEVSHCAKGWNEKVELLVWPHDGDGETRFSLYEDDGVGLGYLKGESARTEIVATTRGGKTSVTVGERRGSFAGAGKVDFKVHMIKKGQGL